MGTQKMMKSAPLGLVYVSDFSRFKTFIFSNDERRRLTSAVDTGFISQNVYLYAAALNYNTAILSLVNRDKLHEIMGLKEHEHIVYTQVIGKAE
jgi:nitroreductase